MQAAEYGEPAGAGSVRCRLCPLACVIAPGRLGACRVRANDDGRLVSLNYGRVAAAAVEPIEKKPLYHFHPGSFVYSLGAHGCNLHCAYCQNWKISQRTATGPRVSPRAAVRAAQAAREADGRLIGLAFTYTEPIVWFEYVRDAAALAHAAGLSVVLKTAGFVNPEPLQRLLEWADALNIDVKAFREEFYRSVCGGGLEPVRRTVEAAVRAGRHVEVSALVVPGRNDEPSEMDELASWLAGLDPRIPLHLPRFYPNWRLDGQPAGEDALEALRRVASRHLPYVYVGGTWQAGHTATLCPGCGQSLVQRDGFRVRATGLSGRCCSGCGRPADFAGNLHGQAGPMSASGSIVSTRRGGNESDRGSPREEAGTWVR